MYIALYRYKVSENDRFVLYETRSLDEKIYVLDTEDGIIEGLNGYELARSDIKIGNIEISETEGTYVITNSTVLGRIKLGVASDTICMIQRVAHKLYSFDIKGIHVTVEKILKRISKYLIVNKETVLETRGDIELAYIFYFRGYAVLRFILWTVNAENLMDWYSVALSSDRVLHCWHGDMHDADGVAMKIDMLSEV